MNLSKAVKFTRILAATAVGTTSIASSLIDMQGFEGVVGIFGVGTITDGTPALKAQGGNLADGSDLADLAGTSTALALTADGLAVSLDVYRPLFRYIKFVFVRAGSTGAVLDAGFAIQYSPEVKPAVQDTSIAASKFVISPAAGTA